VQTLTPLQNAFSKKLAPLGFNLYPMLVIDILHDFELGIWKALFIHLLRILNAADKTLVDELDRRYVALYHGVAAAFANVGCVPVKVSADTYFWAGYHSTLL
jgi:hypothetical protein